MKFSIQDNFTSKKNKQTGSWSVEVTDNVGHSGLVTHDGSKVYGLFGIILRARFYLSTVAGSTLAGEETKRTVTGGFVLKVQ